MSLHVPIGIFPLYFRFVKLCKENKSELFVLWLISDHIYYPAFANGFERSTS